MEIWSTSIQEGYFIPKRCKKEYSLDETGLEKVPVPKFFWKIAYDEKTKKGIAVVGTNNIHRTEEKICTPIEEVPWLKFLDTTDITSGEEKIYFQKYKKHFEH